MMKLPALQYALLSQSLLAQAQRTPSLCSADRVSFPFLLGAELVDLTAREVFNYSAPSLNPNVPVVTLNSSFCNITVTYIHPGWNDTIHVSVWLPPSDSWSGYLQALGGGGYSASPSPDEVPPVLAAGNVATFTDAGHSTGLEALLSPAPWALVSPGNVNLYLLEDFATRSLHDLSIISKSITTDFYGTPPSHTFFSGCSMGGRQAMTLAQRYPTDFNGILATSPSINYEKFAVALYWPTQVMNNLSYYPPPCEIEAFTSAAIDACDLLDDIEDRIISLPGLCNFTASGIIGQPFTACNGTPGTFSAEAASIVQAAWDGPNGDGSPETTTTFPGLNKDASLTSLQITTECANGTCIANPSPLLTDWIIYLLLKDPTSDLSSTLTNNNAYFSLLSQSVTEYADIMGAADPNLSAFRDAGGKLLTWHGLADPILSPNNTITYYEQVLELDAKADEFYRLFLAPGVSHCSGGLGAVPVDPFGALVTWVVNGTVPERLVARDASGRERELCAWPKVQRFVGGEGEGGFECV